MNAEFCKKIIVKMVAAQGDGFLYSEYVSKEDKETFQEAAEILLAEHPGLAEAAFLAEKRRTEACDHFTALHQKVRALGIPWCSAVLAGSPIEKPKVE